MKSILLLKAVFGGADIKLYADIQLVIKFNKGFFFYYVLLIFIENIRRLFTQKIKKSLKLLMLFKIF